MSIITSWLDNDYYNILQAIFFYNRHHDAVGIYAYKCRSKGVNLVVLRDAIKAELESMCRLQFNYDETDYLRMIMPNADGFADAIVHRPILEMQDVLLEIRGDELVIRYRGPIYKRILVETPLLATISQLYYEATLTPEQLVAAHESGAHWMKSQMEFLAKNAPAGFKFTESGTRRRFSKAHHEKVLQIMLEYGPQFLGATSNVLLGRKYGIKAVGTMAHQLQMYYQAICPLEDSITRALADWREFTNAGVALTDTLGDLMWDKVFRGWLMHEYHTERHDSNDPYIWGERRLEALAREGVDTEGRSLLFSDSLDFVRAIALWNHFIDRIGVGIMIGTFIVNTIPMEGPVLEKLLKDTGKAIKPVSQVIKLMWAAPRAEVPMRPVVKLSADMDKSQCECPSLEAHAKWVAMCSEGTL